MGGKFQINRNGSLKDIVKDLEFLSRVIMLFPVSFLRISKANVSLKEKENVCSRFVCSEAEYHRACLRLR